MVWLESQAALAGAELAGRFPCRLALRVADLTLLLLGSRAAPHAALALPGRTPAEAKRWIEQAIGTHTHGEHAKPLVHPGFEIPGRVERFPEPDAALAELGLWYANAAAELGVLASRTSGAGPVLCWPHHFDVATLIGLGAGKTIGVGLSPGDGDIPEPYVYVNHHPPSALRPLPPLDAGTWHTAGWLGALLRGSEIVALGDASAQQGLWRRFVASAASTSRRLLDE
jgi:hypothetical protein